MSALAQTVAERPRHLQLLEEAIEAIETSDDFQTWLAFRARFHAYSWRNSLLIHLQCPGASHVAGYRKWQQLGRHVRKRERGICIIAPNARLLKDTDDAGEERTIRVVSGFRGAHVFDISQTEGEPVPAPPAMGSVTGDSHARFLAPLRDFAGSLGYSVVCEPLEGKYGYCDPRRKVIAIDSAQSPNEQVSILVHETTHAMGVDYMAFSRRGAETIAESVAFVVCRSIGLDVAMSSAPYVAAYSTTEIRAKAIAHIDHYAAEFERALGLHDRKTSLPEENEGSSL